MPFLSLVIFGLLLTAALGLFASWLDRKVTARIQYRVGPPLFQPAIDLLKLLGKENLVPRGASRIIFFGAPLLGFVSVMLVSTVLWVNNLTPSRSFAGDVIVVLYLLAIPSIGMMMGGFASGNPLASVGASREMKLVLSYELPFILAVLVPVIQAGSSLRLGDLLEFQAQHGMVAGTLSGALALAVAILCMQAKLGLVPFDAAEAETEIIGGPLIEYSGAAMALYRLTKSMLLFVLPFFVMTLFLGGLRWGGLRLASDVLIWAALVAATTVIRNVNPRVRIDQTVRFFWGRVAIVGAVAVLLAMGGA
jgi:NADH-quinone oxidoreductase subunit H